MNTQANPFQPFEYLMRQPLTEADRKLVQDYCFYINANGCRPLYDFEQTLLVRALNEAQAEIESLRAPAGGGAVCSGKIIFNRRHKDKIYCRTFKWNGLKPVEALNQLLMVDANEGKMVRVTIEVV